MYIQRQEAIMKDFDVVKVAIGIHTEYLRYENNIEFLGKKIARHTKEEGDKKKNYTLYQTYKGKMLLHVEEKNSFEGSGKSWHKVYDNIVDVEVPDLLFRKVHEDIEEPHTFYIDI